MKPVFQNVSEYINAFPDPMRTILQNIRNLILAHAPDATESISYGMPAYKLNKRPLVYFAGYKNHIGFYGTPGVHTAFAKELSTYKQGKGSVQFPIDAVPYNIIERMVIFRTEENRNKKNQ